MKVHHQAVSLLGALLAPCQQAVGKISSIGLLDPAKQPMFKTLVPNPLDPSFLYDTSFGSVEVSVGAGIVQTGIVDPSDGVTLLDTPVWGYGTPELGYSWPGRTFAVESNQALEVTWVNQIPIGDGHLLTGKDNGELGNYEDRSCIDTSFHWAYSLKGYEEYTIEKDGTPIVPHLHGGHTDDGFDGNPEYFFTSPLDPLNVQCFEDTDISRQSGAVECIGVKGPKFRTNVYAYGNDQGAALLWYHDHALGITRLNVYAGMAGFYIVRDERDTGKANNPLNLPAFPYETALVIQDRFFKENGELFYPAFPGDPFYSDFITDEGAKVNHDDAQGLAEMFGDMITVNGKIWPKMNVEPRKYRLRLLNGCDSRFLVYDFMVLENSGENDFETAVQAPFTIVGGDQGLAEKPTNATTAVLEPSARHDVIFDFSHYKGKRIVMKNSGGDEPFGGDIPSPMSFEHTDKIMAFDVVQTEDTSVPNNFDESAISMPYKLTEETNRVRKVGLFEGHDQFGRLQPLLGTVEPATDMNGNPIVWPDTPKYRDAGLVGQMEGTMPWHAPTTENPKLGDVEEWEIWNLSADAHPLHLHLVFFELVERREIVFDSNVNDDGEIEVHDGMVAAGDGTYVVDMPLVQHDGSMGEGYKAHNLTMGAVVDSTTMSEYHEDYPLDAITALPGQVTIIKVKFDKPGRFNWHCHILAHEDHEMMRIFHVGELPNDQTTHGKEMHHHEDAKDQPAEDGPLVFDNFDDPQDSGSPKASIFDASLVAFIWVIFMVS